MGLSSASSAILSNSKNQAPFERPLFAIQIDLLVATTWESPRACLSRQDSRHSNWGFPGLPSRRFRVSPYHSTSYPSLTSRDINVPTIWASPIPKWLRLGIVEFKKGIGGLYFRSAAGLSHKLAAVFSKSLRKAVFDRCLKNDALVHHFCGS